MRNVLETKSAIKTSCMVAVFLFQLYQGLTVIGSTYIQTACLPLLQYVVLLARQLLQEIRGTCAIVVGPVMHVVGKQQVCHGIYDYKRATTLADAGSCQSVVHVFKRVGVQQTAQRAMPLVKESCHLPDADIGEILRPGAQIVPAGGWHWVGQRELVAQEFLFGMHPVP